MLLRLALAVAALTGSPAAADGEPSAASCVEAAARRPRTVFEVVVSTYPTIIEHGLSIPEINRLRPVMPPPKAVAQGLSVADYHLRYTTVSEATCWQPGGHACAWVGRVRVDMTPDVIRVYIPREYPPGSCEYEQLVRHELEHAQLYRRGAQRVVAEMRFALASARELPGPRTPINASSPEEAYSRLRSMVDQVVRPIYDRFLEEMEAEQQSLDTPGHYRLLGESCPGWKRT